MLVTDAMGLFSSKKNGYSGNAPVPRMLGKAYVSLIGLTIESVTQENSSLQKNKVC